MKKRVYLSGPMTGRPAFGFPAFFEAEEFLKDQGWKVVNPARLDTDLGLASLDEAMPHEGYMKRDLPLLIRCDAIALLPEWWTSKGAKQELSVALMCGLDVICATDGLPLDDYFGDNYGTEDNPHPYEDDGPESPLFEAHRIVHAERGALYGPPEQDFARTGRMWGAILSEWAEDPTLPIPPRLVALCMVALKVSREAYQHKRDSLVDVAGYVETLAMFEGES